MSDHEEIDVSPELQNFLTMYAQLPPGEQNKVKKLLERQVQFDRLQADSDLKSKLELENERQRKLS